MDKYGGIRREMKADQDKLREMRQLTEDGGTLRKMKVYERIWRNMKADGEMRTNEGPGRQMEADEDK